MIYLAQMGFVGLIVLAPLPLGANRPWSWSLLAFGVGLCLLLWTAAAMADRGTVRVSSRRYGPLALVFGFLLLWFLVQAVTFTPEAWHHPFWEAARSAFGDSGRSIIRGSISLDREATLSGVMRLLTYGGVFWLALQLGRSYGRAAYMLWAVAIAATIYGLYGLVVQFADWQSLLWYDKWAYQDSVTGPFVNRNSFATYAGLGLLVVFVFLWREFRSYLSSGIPPGARPGLFLTQLRPRFFILIGMAVTLMAALLLSGSRGGILSAVVGSLVLGGAVIAVHRSRRSWVAVAVAMALAALIAGAFGLDRLETRIATMPVEAQHRAALHAEALTAINERPLLGTGLGTYRYVYHLFKDYRLPFWSLPADKAHSSYLEMAVEGGLPALVLLLTLFAMMIWRCGSGLLRRRQELALPALGLAATALVGIHALVDFSLQIPAVAATYAYLMGIAYAQSWPTQAERAAAELGQADRLP